MFTDWLRRISRGLLDPVSRGLCSIGIKANTVTLLGGLFNIVVGVVIAFGRLPLGGALLILAAGFDALDGSMARQLGRPTRFGAFLDSTLDRVSEIAIFGGLLWHYMAQGQALYVLLSFLALAGSVLVSYTRARAEGLDIECKVGWFTRVERSLLTIVALIADVMPYALWVLVVGTWFTSGQRMWHVYRVVRDEPLA
ncbi:MAG: CDP-alcohol phosphatidyltransferase family protein [Chloroflexi bacterium]|nr:CDP-alcohol phosphatidyltransferase family protein [Chloroflexota bacterium]